MGSEGHGAVGCAAAVDAAIDVIGDGSECCAAVRGALAVGVAAWHSCLNVPEDVVVWGGRRWRTKTVAVGAGNLSDKEQQGER